MWRLPLDPPPVRRELKLALDLAERTAAWTAEWEPGPSVQLVDLDSGEELRRESCAALGFAAGGSAFFALDMGWRLRGHPRRGLGRMMSFQRSGDAVEVDWREWPGRCRFRGVDREGARYLTSESPLLASTSPLAEIPRGPWPPERLVLRAWPDGEEEAQWEGPGWVPDWATETMWRSVHGRTPLSHEVQIAALNGSMDRTVPVAGTPSGLTRVGPGVMRLGQHGVRLCSSHGPAFTPVEPTSRWIPDRDVWFVGDEVRVVLAGRPRVVRVELENGRVLHAPADIRRVARGAPRLWGSALFHPTRPLVTVRWRGEYRVSTVDGRMICAVPDGRRPLAWIASDDSLLTLGGGRGDPALERWLLPLGGG